MRCALGVSAAAAGGVRAGEGEGVSGNCHFAGRARVGPGRVQEVCRGAGYVVGWFTVSSRCPVLVLDLLLVPILSSAV